MIIQVYLISWHHVHCYISRLDVPAERLTKLETGDRHCLQGLCVKRSVHFDMTDPEHRLQVTEAISKIAIGGLSVYSSY